MKTKFAGLFVGLCLGVAPLASHAQVKIMPFGDSVTSRGSAPESSYRYWLWQKLQTDQYSVDFIGQSSGVSDGGTPANPDFDQDYEGGDGLTTGDAVSMAPAASTYQGGPDIVLLDFGSNDISPNPDDITLDQAISNLDQAIQIFAAQNPNIVILIAKPTPFAPDPSASPQDQKLQKREQSQLASKIGQLARTEKKAGIDVITVNLFGGFNVKNNTIDGAHPNVIGEQKIANKYFNVLKGVLKKNFGMKPHPTR